MATGDFSDLSKALQLDKLPQLLEADDQLRAIVSTVAIEHPITFAIQSLLFTISKDGSVSHSTGKSSDALFTLSASPDQWTGFFKKVPKAGYQSYWGMLQSGAKVEGDERAFAQFSHIWRRVLELLHESHNGPMNVHKEEPVVPKEDYVTGKYIYLSSPGLGENIKVYYETSGEGRQAVIFLHDAGTDSRIWNAVLNDSKMRKGFRMFAVDFPGWGRSDVVKGWEGSEDQVVGFVAGFVKKLGLRRPVLCGVGALGGMGCLEVAARNREVGVGGVVPVGGCEALPSNHQFASQSPSINQSLLNAEQAYSQTSPTTPPHQKSLLHHICSSQSPLLPPSSLSSLSTLSSINTSTCPVFMLTGEYDWLCTSDLAQATADKIKGAEHRVLDGVGRFPMVEKPEVFVRGLVEALGHVEGVRREGLGSLRLSSD